MSTIQLIEKEFDSKRDKFENGRNIFIKLLLFIIYTVKCQMQLILNLHRFFSVSYMYVDISMPFKEYYSKPPSTADEAICNYRHRHYIKRNIIRLSFTRPGYNVLYTYSNISQTNYVLLKNRLRVTTWTQIVVTFIQRDVLSQVYICMVGTRENVGRNGAKQQSLRVVGLFFSLYTIKDSNQSSRDPWSLDQSSFQWSLIRRYRNR